jgi:hypothetical protein
MATLDAQPSFKFELENQSGTSSTQTSAALTSDDEQTAPTCKSLQDVAPKLENGTDSSTEPLEDPDVRTIRGFKVRRYWSWWSQNTRKLTRLLLQWFLAYSSLLSTVLFYALDGTIVS